MTLGKSSGIFGRGDGRPGLDPAAGQARGDAFEKQHGLREDEVRQVRGAAAPPQFEIHPFAVGQRLVFASLKAQQSHHLKASNELAAAVAEGGSTGVHGKASIWRSHSGRRHDSSPLADKRLGRARGSRASPGAVLVLPFRRDRLPRAAVFHPPVDCRPFSDLLDSPARRPCGPAAGRTCPALAGRTAVTIRRRAASKRAPSIDARRGPRRYASPRLHRSTTARRHRGTWIRRPPHRRDAPILRPPRPPSGS